MTMFIRLGGVSLSNILNSPKPRRSKRIQNNEARQMSSTPCYSADFIPYTPVHIYGSRKRKQEPQESPRENTTHDRPYLEAEAEPYSKRSKHTSSDQAVQADGLSQDPGRKCKRCQTKLWTASVRSAKGEDSITDGSVIGTSTHDSEIDIVTQDTEMSQSGRKRTRLLVSIRSDSLSDSSRSINPRNVSYENYLERARIYMYNNDKAEPTRESSLLCDSMLLTHQNPPVGSIFADDNFTSNCDRLRNRNEAMVFRDITPLLFPSVEFLGRSSTVRTDDILREEINTSWSKVRPLVNGSIPRPDLTQAFAKYAFSQAQRDRLQPFESNLMHTHFMATDWLYFPFLTCEVKCGQQGLNIADRQNAHNGAVAVHSVVQLFKAVSRVEELHGQVLSFSVSHDNETVRIYAHYPVIDGENIAIYRHPIRKFDFTEQNGKEKWTCYTFIKNVHHTFVPMHLDRIRSAIDQLPEPA